MIIDDKALLEDTIGIFVNHYGLDEIVVRKKLEEDINFMETMVTEMYSAQENYIAHKHEKLFGEQNE